MREAAPMETIAPDTTLIQQPTGPRFVLQGRLPALEAACAAMGAAGVPPMLRVASAPGGTVLRLGPQELLLIGSVPPDGALEGVAHSLVDVSARNVTLLLDGAYATRVLAGLCTLDFAQTAFPVGMATRTLLDKADAMLWRTAPDTFHVEVWRSFAPYVAAALRLVGEEVVFAALAV